jgi:hypothetical protein
MTEKESSWGELTSRLEALGLKLKMHYEQAGDGTEAKETLEKLKRGVQDAFDATGNAVKDEAVRSDVKEAGRLFADAIGESLNKLGDAIKRKAD